MKKNHAKWLAACALFAANTVIAQVGVGTTSPNAALDITSANDGLLIPRIALVNTTTATVLTPTASELVYNTATSADVTPGFYYWSGTAWVRLSTGAGNHWNLTGNAGTSAGTNFLGTTDATDIRIKTAGTDRWNISNANGGQLQSFGLGTAALPAYSFQSDANTGLFSSGSDALDFSTGATSRFRIPAANQVHAMALGTAALPFYSFQADPDTGMFSNTANTLSLATAANERLRLLPNGQVVVNNVGAPGATDMFSSYATAAILRGVAGHSLVANGIGVFGRSTGVNGTGTSGTSNQGTGFGVWGLNTSSTGTGVAGLGNNVASSNYLTAGSGGAFTGFSTGLYGYVTSAGNAQGMILQDSFSAQWNAGYWNGTAYYKIIGNGTVSTVVKDTDGNSVVMHCTETPENLFEDYGVGQLVNGRATISIDPILTKNIIVDDKHPLKVFVQLEGECNGVYVTNKSARSFDVVELQGGRSNTAFSYSIVANRGPETYTSNTGETRVARYDTRFEKAPEFQQNTSVKNNLNN